jgi:hypothetical protein
LRWAGNFYRSETFTLMNQSPVSARISGRNDFHSDSEVFIGEGIRRSGLGETILFRYNSKTQFRHDAPVAQLDRVLGYEPRGWEFDSLRAHHNFVALAQDRAFARKRL